MGWVGAGRGGGGAGAGGYVVYGHGGLSASRGRRGGEHARECYGRARGTAVHFVQLVAPGGRGGWAGDSRHVSAGRDAVLVGVEDFFATAPQHDPDACAGAGA